MSLPEEYVLHSAMSVDTTKAGESDSKDLKDNKMIEINLDCDCGGEPEPGCFSSMSEFKYRVWEFCTRWKYIICC